MQALQAHSVINVFLTVPYCTVTEPVLIILVLKEFSKAFFKLIQKKKYKRK